MSFFPQFKLSRWPWKPKTKFSLLSRRISPRHNVAFIDRTEIVWLEISQITLRLWDSATELLNYVFRFMKNVPPWLMTASTDVLFAKEWKFQMKAHRVALTKWLLLSGLDSFITSPFPPPLPFRAGALPPFLRCDLNCKVNFLGRISSRYAGVIQPKVFHCYLSQDSRLMLKAASFQDWFRDVRRHLNCLFCVTFLSFVAGKRRERSSVDARFCHGVLENTIWAKKNADYVLAN